MARVLSIRGRRERYRGVLITMKATIRAVMVELYA
jgi:hypothetical protein